METLSQYACISCLRPDASPACVAEIVQVSRRDSRLADVTGVLVFDGWRFFHYVEGDQAAVAALVARLRQDPRYGEFQELLSGPFGGPRRFHHWSVAYAGAEAEDLVAQLSLVSGPELIDRLRELLAVSDMEP